MSETFIAQCICGSAQFTRVYPVKGTWTQIVAALPGKKTLQVLESTTDGLSQGRIEPQFMRCATCNRKVKNPDYK